MTKEQLLHELSKFKVLHEYFPGDPELRKYWSLRAQYDALLQTEHPLDPTPYLNVDIIELVTIGYDDEF